MDILTLELRVENRYTEIERVNSEFNEFSRKNGFPDPVRRKFNTVFDELLNNIISYAFRDEGIHIIKIQVTYQAPSVTVEISDDGIPFNLFEVAPPDPHLNLAERPVGGLGIHLVRNMMDSCFYERIGHRNKTTLIKHIGQQ